MLWCTFNRVIEIHPTALIHDTVSIGDGAYVGPYAIVGPHVKIGRNVRLEASCAIGLRPEHKKHWHVDSVYGVFIGDEVVIREGVTVNSGIHRVTSVGYGCSLLTKSHVGHDAILADEVTLSCGALVGGHCYIGFGANIGLNASIHQYRAIGAYAMIGMGSVVVKDIPPFALAYGSPAKAHGENSKCTHVNIEDHPQLFDDWRDHCQPR